MKSGKGYITLGYWPSFHCVCNARMKAFYPGTVSETCTVAIVDFLDDEGVKVHFHSIAQ